MPAGLDFCVDSCDFFLGGERLVVFGRPRATLYTLPKSESAATARGCGKGCAGCAVELHTLKIVWVCKAPVLHTLAPSLYFLTNFLYK